MEGYIWEGQRFSAGISPLGAGQGRDYFGVNLAIASLEAPVENAVAEISWQHVPLTTGTERGYVVRQMGGMPTLRDRINQLPDSSPAALIDNLPGLWKNHAYRTDDMERLAIIKPLWAGVSVPQLYTKGWETLMNSFETILLSPYDPLDIPRINEPLSIIRQHFPHIKRLLVCPLWDDLNARPMSMGYLMANWKALPRLCDQGLIDGFVIKGTSEISTCPEQAAFVKKFITELE